MEKTPEEIIKTQFTIGTMLYTLSAPNWKGLSDTEIADKVVEIEETVAKSTLRSLERNGYAIVPKENIPEAFRA